MTAFAHWTAMHAWWVARRTEHQPIGKPWPPRAATKIGPGEAPVAQGDPLGVAPPPPAQTLEPGGDESHTHSSVSDATSTPPARTVLDLAKERMADDATRGMGSPPPDKPDEGTEIDPALYGAAKAQYETLGPEAKAWMTALVLQGKQGHNWKLNERHSVRRFELYRGVMMLAVWTFALPDGQAATANKDDNELIDGVVRAIVHLILADDVVLQPTFSAGEVVGLLDYAQAAKFAEVAYELTQDRYRLVYREDGTPRIQEVA